MWDGFNKRKFPRINLQCEITIRLDAQPAPFSAITENLGIGGVCVLLDQPMERFSNCRVRLGLGETMPPINCLGRVVWSVPTKELGSPKSRFDTGIEFTDMDPSQKDAVRKFIEIHAQKRSLK